MRLGPTLFQKRQGSCLTPRGMRMANIERIKRCFCIHTACDAVHLDEKLLIQS